MRSAEEYREMAQSATIHQAGAEMNGRPVLAHDLYQYASALRAAAEMREFVGVLAKMEWDDMGATDYMRDIRDEARAILGGESHV